MKKINIVKKNTDFNRIINNNKPYRSTNFILYIEKNTNEVYHFGISVGKKIGNAIIRNKIKRQIRNIIDKNDYQNYFNCIIIVKKSILNIEFCDMKMELNSIFKKLQLTKEK